MSRLPIRIRLTLAFTVVMAVVLGAFGVIAMRVTSGRKPPRRPAADWWACPACGVRNRPDRATCFACQASRADVAAEPAAALDTAEAAVPAEDPHPA